MLKKEQWPILIVNLIYLLVFGYLFFSRKNYEFVVYVGVVLFFIVLILWTNDRVGFSNTVLWGLTLWGFLHMAGGGLIFSTRLYDTILVNISSTYQIFKYDQLVHIIGFGVATLVMWELIEPLLVIQRKWVRIGIVVVMAGLGMGALNEILEFTATVFIAETGVGGYVNTSLDLVADLIGALIAFFVIKVRDK